MAADNIIDLDVLRPASRFVRIADVEIDVSFVPCGITFEVDTIVREMGKLDQVALQEGGEVARRGFELTLELCSLFCQRKHPEMTVEWFEENTDAQQLGLFADAIKAALFRSYEGIGDNGANPPKAPRRKGTAKSA